jgi:hypothetical protein
MIPDDPGTPRDKSVSNTMIYTHVLNRGEAAGQARLIGYDRFRPAPSAEDWSCISHERVSGCTARFHPLSRHVAP